MRKRTQGPHDVVEENIYVDSDSDDDGDESSVLDMEPAVDGGKLREIRPTLSNHRAM